MLQGLGLRQLLSLWRKKGARWWNRYFFPVILLTKRITAFFLLLPVFLLCCGCTVERVVCVWQRSRVCVCVQERESVRFEERGSPLQQLFFRLPYQQLFCFPSLFSHISPSLSFSFLSNPSLSSVSCWSRWLNSQIWQPRSFKWAGFCHPAWESEWGRRELDSPHFKRFIWLRNSQTLPLRTLTHTALVLLCSTWLSIIFKALTCGWTHRDCVYSSTCEI